MISTAPRVRRLAAAMIPFAALPVLLTWSIPPLARTAAQWFHFLLDGLPLVAVSPAAVTEPPASAPGESGDPRSDEGARSDDRAESTAADPAFKPGAPRSELADRRSRRPAFRAALGGSSIASIAGFGADRTPQGAHRPHVFVGPEAIQRAIPAPGRPTSTWTNRTDEHPAGVLIQTPGALGGVIESGDILFEAEGQPIGSFEQLVVIVKQAYDRRAKRLSGRIFRKGHLVPVTVEPGW